MENLIIDYLDEEKRFSIFSNGNKTIAIRNGRKLPGNHPEQSKIKPPATVLAVNRHGYSEIIKLNGSNNVECVFEGPIPFRNPRELENFFVTYCISIAPFRLRLEKLFNEAKENKPMTKEEFCVFALLFNYKHQVRSH